MIKRQELILEIIRLNQEISSTDILKALQETSFSDVTKITVIRDLNILISNRLIKKLGVAKSIKYAPVYTNPLLEIFDTEKYFEKDLRKLKYPMFNFNIYRNLKDLFLVDEISALEICNEKFRKNFSEFPNSIIKKELERLTVEFSWKSSRIEGNTYSLLDTERLLKDNIQAVDHSPKESQMILNHKDAMDFIFNNRDSFKKVSIFKIEEVHQILTKGLDISSGLRSFPVGIIGTDYKPLDNKFQVKEAIEHTLEIINSEIFPIEKSLLAIAMISYIQPFEDGNKRTSRLIGNAILLANNFCPLSYKSVDEIAYKKAMILFYEQNSISYFKELFVEQFKNAVEKYF